MKERSDSYLASLTEEQRDAVCGLLLQRPSLSLVAVRELVPAYGNGPRDGAKPSLQTLSKIHGELQLEESLRRIDVEAKFLEATKAKLLGSKLSGTDNEAVLEQVLTLIGQEVIQKTLERDDPKNRTAAVRLLLKRADQRRFDRRMSFLESQQDKAKKVLGNEKLSAEEKQLKMRQIFGM